MEGKRKNGAETSLKVALKMRRKTREHRGGQLVSFIGIQHFNTPLRGLNLGLSLNKHKILLLKLTEKLSERKQVKENCSTRLLEQR